MFCLIFDKNKIFNSIRHECGQLEQYTIWNRSEALSYTRYHQEGSDRDNKLQITRDKLIRWAGEGQGRACQWCSLASHHSTITSQAFSESEAVLALLGSICHMCYERWRCLFLLTFHAWNMTPNPTSPVCSIVLPSQNPKKYSKVQRVPTSHLTNTFPEVISIIIVTKFIFRNIYLTTENLLLF